jgi:hypothetical protein
VEFKCYIQHCIKSIAYFTASLPTNRFLQNLLLILNGFANFTATNLIRGVVHNKKRSKMKHYEYEISEKFSKKDYEIIIENAKNTVIKINGNDKIIIEIEEQIINKMFNDFIGVFEKHRVLKSGNLIGYLEFFRNNDFNYLNIYTSPLN